VTTPAELRDHHMRGLIVAMTTPFKEDLSIDVDGLRRLTDFYAEAGVPAVIAAGSTGEFHALSDDERKLVIETVVKQAQRSARPGRRLSVIAGCAHSGTQLALEMTRFAEDAGADGAMITPPYYGFSGFEGLQRHYELISAATSIGIVVYFSGAVLSKVTDVIAHPPLLAKLCEIPHLVGFKDSTGNYAFYRDISLMLAGKVAIMGSGGMGYYLWGHIFGSPCSLAGIGNIWPEVELRFHEALARGDRATAERIVIELDLPYLAAARNNYFAAVKAMLDMAGLPGGPVRPPLVDWKPEARRALQDIVERIGLLEPTARVPVPA
jgi:dihydrodipicolinate synthase/N-acetylneuraminate lyase